MYNLEQTGRFKKDVKLAKKRGLNMLLVWEQNETIKLITLVRTGTHSDLF